jgi:hypothetical protein
MSVSALSGRDDDDDDDDVVMWCAEISSNSSKVTPHYITRISKKLLYQKNICSHFPQSRWEKVIELIAPLNSRNKYAINQCLHCDVIGNLHSKVNEISHSKSNFMTNKEH